MYLTLPLSSKIIIMMMQMWKNNTNFLHSGPYIDLPAYHPTRLFNILVGGLYMVVVPFVYFKIFRYNENEKSISSEMMNY